MKTLESGTLPSENIAWDTAILISNSNDHPDNCFSGNLLIQHQYVLSFETLQSCDLYFVLSSLERLIHVIPVLVIYAVAVCPY